jgi:hypothetical protein
VDHVDRERAPAREDFRSARARAEQLGEFKSARRRFWQNKADRRRAASWRNKANARNLGSIRSRNTRMISIRPGPIGR